MPETSAHSFPGLRPGVSALLLAPMEGVTDAPMRQWMGERGGFTHCVTEFLRVSQDPPPARVIRDHVPEWRNGWRTRTGTPCQLQLLGGDPEKLAATAALAVRELGAPAVDLNFGCPAPTVNRHDGGATLLKYPHRIRAIVEAVRKAVPAAVAVSAKLRLGWDSLDAIHENADMAAQGGASWITIHGRTRMAGYAPPAYWGPIGEVRRRLGIPVVANGDLWTLDDFRRCREQTGAEHYMLGRCALADPNLVHQIARELGLPHREEAAPAALGVAASDWAPLLRRFVEINAELDEPVRYALARVKQWVRMAHLRFPIAWFEELKRAQSVEEALAVLERLGGGTAPSAAAEA
jgi:tRNA-dihydrouridine synthase C